MPTTTTPARQVLGGPRWFWNPRANFGPWISFLGLPVDKYVPCAPDAPEPPTNGDDAGETAAADMLDEEDMLEDEKREAA
ncbi:hypothetical protein N7530_006592 [Penicillium desertorum]|uniref:Uncharacterized protein n=1 Tax=Penicillium desertorum TaxID=1303715 RepID=A0A9W9WRZ3_9EURO|nr:hypothetical protein N7530_006592 [Penicillium desertorum]